jgi:hypothetical protein
MVNAPTVIASYAKFNVGVVFPKAFPRVRLFTVIGVAIFTVTFAFMRTSSVVVGTVPVDQFAAVDQFVSVPPIQLTLAAQVVGTGILEKQATIMAERMSDLRMRNENFAILFLRKYCRGIDY